MKINVRKLTLAALFAVIAVVFSAFAIPVGGAKILPVQHMVNVLCGVLLGPWYALGAGFVAASIRIMLGTGSLLAFPGSMIGAFFCGMIYRHTKKMWAAYAGELFGTGIIGALLSYPIAVLVMGNKTAAMFTFVLPFSLSSAVGAAISVVLITALQKTGALDAFQRQNQ